MVQISRFGDDNDDNDDVFVSGKGDTIFCHVAVVKLFECQVYIYSLDTH